MYSYEDKKRAIELYIKYDKSAMAVVNELGYPSRTLLYYWYKEYEENGGRVMSGKGYRKYSDEQMRAAVDHYLDHGRCLARTMRAMGYPGSKELLATWIDELEPGARKRRLKSRAYTYEERRTAVLDLMTRKGTAKEIADAHGIKRSDLYNWKRELLGEGGTKLPHKDLPDDIGELEERVRSLQEQVRRLEMEKDILEGTIELLGKGQGTDPNRLTNREKAILVNSLQGKYQQKELLCALSMAKSSYRYQLGAMSAPDKYADLRIAVRRIFDESGYRYGYRRIHAKLKAEGERVSEKVVARVMAEEGLVARSSRKRRRYSSYAGEISEAPKNLVNRDFHADVPNRLWLTDITEFRIPAGKVYLSPIIDCFDGMVVSWSMSTSPNAELVNTMLECALGTLEDGERPVIHNDRGSHYRWPGWISLCDESGLVRSMSAKGCSPDNAACEGFFGRLKVEFFYGSKWKGWTVDEFMDALDDYIRWYNEERIKKSLGWTSPLTYRKNLGLAA